MNKYEILSIAQTLGAWIHREDTNETTRNRLADLYEEIKDNDYLMIVY
jgi:hypothetical protein